MTKIREGSTKGNVKDVPDVSIRPKGPPPPASKDAYVYSGEIPPPPDDVHMSEREKDWREFAEEVALHLRNYTVPQYGDKGEDVITGYSVEECVVHIEKYAKRYGSQSREGQQELDFLKIAHYAQCAWEKYEPLKTDKKVYTYKLSSNVADDLWLENEGWEFIGVTSEEDTEVHIFRRLT